MSPGPSKTYIYFVLKLEMEEMSRSLKESEAAVQSLEINIDELKTHAKLTEQVDFQKWLESVILNDEKGFVDSMKHPAESVSDDASDNKENEIPNLQSSSSSSTCRRLTASRRSPPI